MKRRLLLISVIVAILAIVAYFSLNQSKVNNLDEPVSIVTLENEVKSACDEVKKRQEAFSKRFPSEDSRQNNDEVLHSEEWKQLMDWTEACTQSKAQLEESKQRH